MTEHKFCVDCKWCSRHPMAPYDGSFCKSPKGTYSINLISGVKQYDVELCKDVRSLDKLCGFEGKWWESKSIATTKWQKLKT